eukprot:300568-Rhodomonas_salina.1
MPHGRSKGKGKMRVKDICSVAPDPRPARPKHEDTTQRIGQVIKVSADELFRGLDEEHKGFIQAVFLREFFISRVFCTNKNTFLIWGERDAIVSMLLPDAHPDFIRKTTG